MANITTLQQNYTNEATVIVWRNITKFGIIPTGHFGHAAVMLRGPRMGLGGNQYQYISWWPGDGAGKSDFVRQQDGISEDDYEQDMRDEMSERVRDRLERGDINPRHNQRKTSDGEWGVEADSKISVPGIGLNRDRTHTFGLDLNRMWRWYNDYTTNNGKYQLASKKQSCSGVALVALIEGGSTAFKKAPSIKIYSEPKQVDAYAIALRNSINTLNGRVVIFENRAALAILRAMLDMGMGPGGGLGGVTGFQAHPDLWSYRQWKRQSAVARLKRDSVIRSIDSQLKSYHKLLWGDNFTKKYTQLVKIMDLVMKHEEKYPESKRAFALQRLGTQVLDKARNLPLPT